MANKTFLIVDDSRVARMMIASLVLRQRPSWKITHAENGSEALSTARKTSFDYISVDYNMPGMDGLMVAETLAREQPASRIVLLTANVQSAIEERAQKLGVGYVGKPLTETSISALLDQFGD